VNRRQKFSDSPSNGQRFFRVPEYRSSPDVLLEVPDVTFRPPVSGAARPDPDPAASRRPGLPKLVATDLDGTIVRSDGTVSDRTTAALHAVRAYGIPVVGVTGRGPRLLDLNRRDLPAADFMVCAQGAHVADLSGCRSTAAEPMTLFAAEMAGAVAAGVVAAVEEVAGPLTVLVEPATVVDTLLWGEPHPSWPYAEAVHACSRAEAFAVPLFKAFLHAERYDADELLAIARTVVAPEAVELTQAGLGYVEVCPAGITKASGLAVVAGHLGVDAADVLVFGDMPNDLPMFGWAGWGRIAVANAHPALLVAADDVTLSNDEDGVAVYLERMLASD
jgi:hydroxymethylpyrimidine pyrophosphatase-like HAD family hydrolase